MSGWAFAQRCNPFLFFIIHESIHQTTIMKKGLVFLLFIFVALNSKAQTARALLIGINKYEPPANASKDDKPRTAFFNLNGAVNDAQAVKSIIQARYQFQEENIVELYNDAANRAAIIQALEQLLTDSKSGDVAFFFYAGHGMLVTNSLSVEADKKDEAIVPADYWKKDIKPIRDKELSAIYNRFIDKGVTLTVITDCCHSGSLGRGVNNNLLLHEPPTVRYIQGVDFDAKDNSGNDKAIAPENRKNGALIMAASQDIESASEISEDGERHGIFTLSLIKAIKTLPSNVSVNNLFASVRAAMMSYGKMQEPVLGGPEERKNAGLFGATYRAASNRLLIGITIDKNGKWKVNGGRLLGINIGSRLKKIGAAETIEIIAVSGINSAEAKLVKGNKENVQSGNLFELTNWMNEGKAALKIYVPKKSLSIDDIRTLSAKLKNGMSATSWVKDILSTQPSGILFYNNGKWTLSTKKKALEHFATFPDAAAINKRMNGAPFFLNIPPPQSLIKALSVKTENTNVALVNDINEAQYSVCGKMNDDGTISYALVKCQALLQDNAEPLPKRTNYEIYGVGIENDVADHLAEYAFKLAKIRTWTGIDAPGNSDAPYSLVIKKGYNNSVRNFKDSVTYFGDTLSGFFVVDEKKLKQFDDKDPKNVYVFLLDSAGTIKLMYPSANFGNVENKLPQKVNGKLETETFLFASLVEPPSGTDYYFMLVTDEAISNPLVIEQEGVLTKGRSIGSSINSLFNLGTTTRSPVMIENANWMLLKNILKSKQK